MMIYVIESQKFIDLNVFRGKNMLIIDGDRCERN
jgi:hypothetical protein